MSLLDQGNETVTICPTTWVVDEDGNQMPTHPVENQFSAWVRIQPAAQSGTSARRAEQDNEGFESEEVYRMRFPRSQEVELDTQDLVLWNGGTWNVTGHPFRHNGSPRTRRLEYTIRRT